MENYAQNSQKRMCRWLLWKEYPPCIIPFVKQFLVFPYFTDKEITAQQNDFGEISNPSSNPNL